MNPARRQFLKTAMGFSALVALPRFASARGIAEARSLDLGYSLYGMPGIPLREALEHCARIGYRNVELVLDPGGSADPAKLSAADRQDLRAQLADLKLSVSALMRNVRLTGGELSPAENVQAIRAAAAFSHEICPGAPPPIETTLGGEPAQWESLRGGMAEALVAWARTAEEARIDLVLKAHVFMAVNTPERLLWLLDRAPSRRLGVTFDYSHFEPQGISLARSWAQLAPRTRFVHVKDTRMEEGKVVMALPGEGRVDYRQLFRLMEDSSYRGPVVVEVSSMVSRKNGYDSVASARRCHDFLASEFAAFAGS